MIALFRVQDEFPHARVEAAKKLILSYKPWWSTILNSMPIVPISVPVPEDGNYGGMTSTDRDMHLYIDTHFAMNAPLEHLAGSIERELQRHIRDTWSRFSWLSAEEWDRQVNICIDLEIASSLKREYNSGLGERRNTNIFSDKMAEKWGVTTYPNLYGVGWSPDMLDLEDGKSAEEYYKLLNEPLQNQKNQDEDEETPSPDDESENETEENPDSGMNQNPESGDSQENDSESSDSSESNDENSGDNSDSESQAGEQSESGEESGEGDGSQDSADSPENGEAESTDDENGSGNDPGGDSDESDSSLDSSSDSSSDGDAEGDTGGSEESGDGGDPESGQDGEARNDEIGTPQSNGQGHQSVDDSDRFGGNPESGAESVSQDAVGNGQSSSLQSSPGDFIGGSSDAPRDRMDMAENMMNQSPELSWMADDFQSPKSTSEPSWEPDEQDQKPGVPESEQKEMKADLAEKVKARFPNGSRALEGMEEIAQWAEREKRKSPDHWTNRLTRIASLAADSAQIDGSGDLTYEKRNPNQEQIGPILMGMIDYSPTIYTLNDQSFSMVANNGLLRAADTFLDLTKSMFARFGTTSLWIGVDTDIRYVGKPQSPRSIKKAELPMLFATGGTDFGHVMSDISKGKLRFEGKRYKRPDLLVINTDCKFRWPEEWTNRKRPINGMKVIVCSVVPYNDIKHFLPDWINPKANNFIEVDYR